MFSQNIFSQAVKATDTEVKISKDKQSAISIISEAEINSLQKSWASYLKKNYNAKNKSRKNTLASSGLLIPSISIKPLNLYSFFEKNEQGSEMIITAEIDSVAFISPETYPDEFKSLKAFSSDFVISYLKSQYSQLIKDKQKDINKSVKEELKMQKKINNLEKSISRDNNNIQRLQKRIEENKVQIDRNKNILPELNKKTSEKRNSLKELEKRKDKL
jgi:uncharacterized coiled-coil protein SlyX